MNSTVAATRQAQLSVVEYCLPGDACQPAGVVLFDPETREWRARFRRDWKDIAGEEAEVLNAMAEEFAGRMEELGPEKWLRQCEDSLSHVWRIRDRERVTIEPDLDRALGRLYSRHVQPKVLPFVTHLPKFSARVAAGQFLEDHEVEAEDWIEAPRNLRLDERMFVVEITGRSMEPRIPDGSLCVFRAGVAGTRQGKLLLVERRDVSESGGRYTVKRYRSDKATDESGWRHAMIRLEPLNPEFDAWELEDDPEQFRIIGEFLQVLT